MMNQVILVGKLVNDVKIKTEENKRTAKITLAVQRCFKNSDGIYETDFVDCVLLETIADRVVEYCKKDDVVAIKGRIQTSKEDNKMIIIAEKVTFLSSQINN